MGYYTNNILKAHQRHYVERFFDSELSVPEWCRRNGIKKQTMYRWLTNFAEAEPELFGGEENIAERTKRMWVETTKLNIRSTKAIATLDKTILPPGEEVKAQTPAVILVDTLYEQPAAVTEFTDVSTKAHPISIELNKAKISIPPGSSKADIAAVLEAVSLL